MLDALEWLTVEVQRLSELIATNRNLAEASTATPPGEVQAGTLSVAQAAEYLGLSKGYVYTLAKTHELPLTRIGRRLLFLRTDLDAWLASRTLPSVSDDVRRTAAQARRSVRAPRER